MSQGDKGLERLIFFSDAVFAIAITLLAIEIKLPNGGHTTSSVKLSHDLANLIPEYQGYIISFLIIGFYWINHHEYFRYIERYDYKLIWLNTLLLMCIAFLPFPTSVLDIYSKQPIAVVFYAVSMMLTGFIKAIIWCYASARYRLIPKNLPTRVIRLLGYRAIIPPAIFFLSIPIAFIHPLWAEFSWTLIPISFILLRRFYLGLE